MNDGMIISFVLLAVVAVLSVFVGALLLLMIAGDLCVWLSVSTAKNRNEADLLSIQIEQTKLEIEILKKCNSLQDEELKCD